MVTGRFCRWWRPAILVARPRRPNRRDRLGSSRSRRATASSSTGEYRLAARMQLVARWACGSSGREGRRNRSGLPGRDDEKDVANLSPRLERRGTGVFFGVEESSRRVNRARGYRVRRASPPAAWRRERWRSHAEAEVGKNGGLKGLPSEMPIATVSNVIGWARRALSDAMRSHFVCGSVLCVHAGLDPYLNVDVIFLACAARRRRFPIVQVPPSERSSRKQPEQSWRRRNG